LNSFVNTYANLPKEFYFPFQPDKVPAPKLIGFNHALSEELGLGLENTGDNELAQIFSGNKLMNGTEPIALAYAGHQFGQFVPQLGDGRAVLLGEVDTAKGRFDIQLKGSGATPFSRRGDGKSPLGPVVREFLVSEFMHRMDVPTTRALAAVATGETVHRERSEPGGVFTRVASSHIRVGTFQYFFARQEVNHLKTLMDYAIARHYSDIDLKDPERPLLLLKSVLKRQADLIARWMSVGFIHGVMNTDNTSVAGITLDYGPCAFMDDFDFQKVFSFIDRNGRYAYNRQPHIMLWNLARLADTLLPLMEGDDTRNIKKLEKELSQFELEFEQCWRIHFCRKLGLAESKDGEAMVQSWLKLLSDFKLDYTLSYRYLSEALNNDSIPEFFASTGDQGELFIKKWKSQLEAENVNPYKAAELMNTINPLVIPRNHWIQKVIDEVEQGNVKGFDEFYEVLKEPFKSRSKDHPMTLPPAVGEQVETTFCGT
tara:strand:+ start:115835 stop:117289 length:1455 start_codon:yes stop_codon:yes gene_type:complete